MKYVIGTVVVVYLGLVAYGISFDVRYAMRQAKRMRESDWY